MYLSTLFESGRWMISDAADTQCLSVFIADDGVQFDYDEYAGQDLFRLSNQPVSAFDDLLPGRRRVRIAVEMPLRIPRRPCKGGFYI